MYLNTALEEFLIYIKINCNLKITVIETIKFYTINLVFCDTFNIRFLQYYVLIGFFFTEIL